VLQHVFMALPDSAPFVFALLATHIELLSLGLSRVRFATRHHHLLSCLVVHWLRRLGVLALFITISFYTFHGDYTHHDEQLCEQLHNALALWVLIMDLAETQIKVNIKIRQD
jgi:hypothetical protein